MEGKDQKDGNFQKKLRKVASQLPYDCWGEIALFLGGYSEFRIILLSVPGLYDYIQNVNNYCSKNLFFRAIDFPKRGLKLRHVKHVVVGESKVLVKKPYLKKKETPYQSRISKRIHDSTTKTSIIKKMMTSFPDLQSIQLFLQHFPSRSKTIIDVGKNLPQNHPLKKLSIGHCKDFTLNVHFDNLPQLESVTLEYKKQFTTTHIFYFTQQSIDIEFYVFGKDENIPLPKLKELKIMNVANLFMNNEYLEYICEKSLKILHLQNTNPFVTDIVNFPFLESLSLISLDTPVKCISKLPNLRILRIVSKRGVYDWSSIFESSDAIGFEKENEIIDCESVFPNLHELDLKNVYLKPKELSYISSNKIRKLCLKLVGGYQMKQVPGIDATTNKVKVYDEFIFPSFSSSSSDSDFNVSSSSRSLQTLTLSSLNIPYRIENLYDVKHLDLLIKKDIFLNLDDMRTSLEILRILPVYGYSDETIRFFIHSEGFVKPPHTPCEFLNESKPYHFRLSQFLRLKELILKDLTTDVNSVKIDHCEELKKIEIFESTSDRKYILCDLPKLSSLKICKIDPRSNLIISKCPKIAMISLDSIPAFPKGVRKDLLTEMEINKCERSLFKNQTIDGLNVFRKLKYLSITQHSVARTIGGQLVVVGEDEKEKYVSVKRLEHLDSLWKLEISSNYIQECGIESIIGLSEHVDVVLKYNKGIFRERSVVRTMDKKRFLKFFNEKVSRDVEDEKGDDSTYLE